MTKTKQRLYYKKYKAIKAGYKKIKDEITYKQFLHRVNARMIAEGVNTKQAVKKELNTEQFVSAAERSRVNFAEGLKANFKEQYKELRNLSRDHGKFKAFKQNLVWDARRGGYVLGGKYFIDVSNSPETISIIEI